MVVALVVESSSSHLSKKDTSDVPFSRNTRNKKQNTRLDHRGTNAFRLTSRITFLPPSALSCTQDAQL